MMQQEELKNKGENIKVDGQHGNLKTLGWLTTLRQLKPCTMTCQSWMQVSGFSDSKWCKPLLDSCHQWNCSIEFILVRPWGSFLTVSLMWSACSNVLVSKFAQDMEKQYASQVVAGSKHFANAILHPHVSLLFSLTLDAGLTPKTQKVLFASRLSYWRLFGRHRQAFGMKRSYRALMIFEIATKWMKQQQCHFCTESRWWVKDPRSDQMHPWRTLWFWRT